MYLKPWRKVPHEIVACVERSGSNQRMGVCLKRSRLAMIDVSRALLVRCLFTTIYFELHHERLSHPNEILTFALGKRSSLVRSRSTD